MIYEFGFMIQCRVIKDENSRQAAFAMPPETFDDTAIDKKY